MEIAVYGGSFNPPHVGHALVASWLRWTGRCDAVWLLPAAEHALDKVLPPFDERVRLCQALASALDAVEVCTIEGELPTPSYTWNTLSALAERHPEHRFRLVVGADILQETDRWHRWPDIERVFSPIIVGRGGYPDVPGTITFPEVSSSDIRARLEAGKPVDHLVPAAVLELL
ncbi:MAG: nicotinate-nicotinamide nucleotide adenylyltransferase [Proteobacteria bacterium]|nr:nicotinate-nicotinamide nucleotide adenylyltransferase [Pseudomonadota bacterium]MCP4921923.1 nicotinate-nicotinamide nucleotide adenylyltransferase [Pseudomonadota bacterium]